MALIQGCIWTFSYFLYLPFTVTDLVYDQIPESFPGIRGHQAVIEIAVPLGKIDPGPVVQALIDAQPDAIFSSLFGPDLARFVREGALHLFAGIDHLLLATVNGSIVSVMVGEGRRSAYAVVAPRSSHWVTSCSRAVKPSNRLAVVRRAETGFSFGSVV